MSRARNSHRAHRRKARNEGNARAIEDTIRRLEGTVDGQQENTLDRRDIQTAAQGTEDEPQESQDGAQGNENQEPPGHDPATGARNYTLHKRKPRG